MDSSFEFITTLQYRLKAAREELEAFRSGEKYRKLEKEHKKTVRYLERKLKKVQQELSESRREAITARDHWFEVFEDLTNEMEKLKRQCSKQTKKLEERALRAERKYDEAQDTVKRQNRIIWMLFAALQEETGKNQKLKAQINHDYENSSLPSSYSIEHKKIPNSREKTGRKPGGQPGHKGHTRKKQTPTMPPVLLPPPQEVMKDPDFKKTKKTIIKQLVNIRMVLDVKEYRADVYYNSKTGERVHAPFPDGVVNDVNYGGSVRAFLFLLNNECCVSIDKSRKFLSDLTQGKLNISKGMINKLSHEFSKRSKKQQKKMFSDLLLSPVMHTDCTNAKVNGKSAYVFVCASPDGKAMYFMRDKKGHEGIKGTPVEDYQGILVHDHDTTFYSYGDDHQECLAHIQRYLKDSIQNETDKTWSKKMHSLIQEMIHYRNSLSEGSRPDDRKVAAFEKRYEEILQTAEKEYTEKPPGKYYRDGYNVYARMKKDMHNYLLFLHDTRVPATNNKAERLLRNYKRKQKQAVTFRSAESIGDLCDCMSMLLMMRKIEENNIFELVSQIYEEKTDGSD